jgi:hypothetical protein
MTQVVIVNIVLWAVVVTGMVGLPLWAIVTQEPFWSHRRSLPSQPCLVQAFESCGRPRRGSATHVRASAFGSTADVEGIRNAGLYVSRGGGDVKRAAERAWTAIAPTKAVRA